MANKYLTLVGRVFKYVEALVVSAGAGDSGKIVALDAAGKLDLSLFPTGMGAEMTVCLASENLAAGDFVNLHLSGGVIKARKADATNNSKPAHGFTKLAVTSGNTASVYRVSQTNDALSGLTIGSEYFLSASTPGAITTTAPTSSGNIVQYLGIAESATALVFENVVTVELA